MFGFLGSCSSDQGVMERDGTDTWYQEPTNQVDILWVVDDSVSMAEEQKQIADGFEDFINAIQETNTDFHLGVITTSFDYNDPSRGKLIGDPAVITAEDDYINLFRDRVRVGTGGSDREKGLEAASYALSPAMTTGANEGFLRTEAYLLLIFVSDENDCSDRMALEDEGVEACYEQTEKLVPVDTFVSELRNIKYGEDQVLVGSIIGPHANEGCEDATPGFRYEEFTLALGGLVGNICDTEFSSVMVDLGLNATGVRSTFQLSEMPKEGTIEAYVDEVLIEEDPTNGWTFDESTLFLSFWGDTVPARGTTIVANYTIQPGS